MPSYFSINEFPGDGATTQHNFSFAGGYIDKAHVKAVVYDAVGGATPVTITAPMWVGANTLNLGISAPVGGYTKIYRETPRDLPLVDFDDQARLREANLDLLARQAIFVAAEAFDAGAYASVNDLLAAAATSAASASAAAGAAATGANTSTAQAAAAIAAAAQAATTLDNAVVKTGDQTIAGVKTFTSSPVVPAGASGTQTPQAQEIGALAGAQLTTHYKRSNILGTVSQSAGVPTGAVIETGTNANGTYTRFADGTQICRATLTTSAGSPRVWTFPALFYGTGTQVMLTSGGAVVLPIFDSVSTASCTFGTWNTSGGALIASTCSAVAIGRWF